MRISWRNLFWKLLTFLISEIDAFSLTQFLRKSKDLPSKFQEAHSLFLYHFQVLRHHWFLQFPGDVHGEITMRRNIVHKAETMERTSVSKTVFLFLTHKKHNLVMPLRLLGVNPSSTVVMGVGVLGLPMEVVFIDDIIIVLRRR